LTCLPGSGDSAALKYEFSIELLRMAMHMGRADQLCAARDNLVKFSSDQLKIARIETLPGFVE
jgi:hypothetical protein